MRKKKLDISGLGISILNIIVPIIIFNSMLNAIVGASSELSVLKIIAIGVVFIPFTTLVLIHGMNRTAYHIASVVK